MIRSGIPMDASMTPINGISLEQYAELSAAVTDCVNDPEACAKIVEGKGVSRADWEAAHKGWLARMQDMALMGRVAIAYGPLYNAALAKLKGTVDCSFEDYIALAGARKALGEQRFNAQYQIDNATYYQLAGTWNNRFPTDPRYHQGPMQIVAESTRIEQGGAPRPVSLSRQAGFPTAPAPQAAPTPAAQAAIAQQQQQNEMMAQAIRAQVAAVQANANAQAAAAYGNASANMGMMGKGMLGMMGMGAIASGIGPGMQVLVQWSDGNRYPAQCMQVANGQVCVAFGDGRQLWVPESAVSRQG